MAKGKPRHKDLDLDEKILKNHEMFMRRMYGTELSDEEKADYLDKTRKNLEKLGKENRIL